jgi:hypothetical protein
MHQQHDLFKYIYVESVGEVDEAARCWLWKKRLG